MSNEPSRLIVRYLSNEATPEEQEELLDWVSASADNQRIFHEYALAWNQEEMCMPLLNKVRPLQSLNSRIDALEHDKAKRTGPLWVKIAAAITLLVVSSALAWRLFRPSEAVQYAEVTTGTGQRTTIRLADGTTVRLNAHSTLRYPAAFKGDTREVFLYGEAFFEVTHNPQMPFVVHTDAVATEVLGTSFNVDADSAQVAVTVATGKVKVSGQAQQEILLPRDQVRVLRKSGAMKRSQVNLDRALAWTRNTLVFDNTALEDVARKLEHWYGTSISLDNARVSQCRITGTYRNETLTHILEAISFSTGTKFRIGADGKVILSGSGCD
ncbi:MAG TPA: FecR domain-containing protein [Chryseolinea sp.]|nr:FecR domain-containing protein [Chryseolinea sp.]